MTDNEIIKALECCFVNRSCKDCPLDENNEDASCTRIVKNEAAKLCLRQQAEIERLEEKSEEKSTEIKALISSVDRLMKVNKQEVIEYLKKINFNAFPKEILNAIKAEALNEFERKIKAHAYYIDTPKEHRVVDEDDIDAVLKEMTEQSVNYGSSKTVK